MFATSKIVSARLIQCLRHALHTDSPRIKHARIGLGLLLVGLLAPLLYTLISTHNAMAQTPDSQTPDTVVFPPFHNRLPLIKGGTLNYGNCPAFSTNQYESLDILGHPRPVNAPPSLDPDVNLAVRGYSRTTAILDLIAIDGPTDDDAPQLAYLFRPARVSEFTAVHRVNSWNWECCPGGTLGPPIIEPEVTLVDMATTAGEAIYAPRRNAKIGGEHYAMILYAEPSRITFTYTLDDSPVYGYLIHIENICVDPNLLAFYQEMHAAGRKELPALRREDSLGTALGDSLSIAVRDTGSFMDPRSAKDWWQDTVRAMLAGKGKLP